MKKLWLVFTLMTVLLASSLIVSVPNYAVSEMGTVTIGWGTTFYITKDGTLYGYGTNAEDLFPGQGSSVEEPVKLMTDVKSVSANRYAVVVVKRDSTMWYWGRLCSLPKVGEPTKIMDNVVSAAIEPYYNKYAMMIKTDGTLWKMNSDTAKEFVQVPHDHKVKFIALGGSNHFFINENDELWGWSTDKTPSSALGVGHTNPVYDPVKIMDGVQQVASYTNNTLIVRKDGSLWGCGNGDDGKFYNGTTEIDAPISTPIKMMDNVVHAAVYDSRFLAITKDNVLWFWGNNILSNQISSGHVAKPEKLTTDAVYATLYGHIAVIKKDNTLWTGGSKNGVYHAEQTNKNELRLTASNLQDAPAVWALAEVREAEYRKLVPPSMQSEYTKIVTRSEFCTLAIICLEEANQMAIEDFMKSKNMDIPTSSPFGDISHLTDRAQKDIMAAFALNIVSGTSSTTFTPDKQITREQAAKMLTETAIAAGKTNHSIFPAFADANETAEWAKSYIGYVYDFNIMSGVGSNQFNPKGGYQRQQAYITLLRLYNNITQ